jgi:3-methyladenine DNA glycosylase AlkD
MKTIEKVKNELHGFGDSKRGANLYKFFQAFPGGYGEGDTFIGVTVPHQRLVAKVHYKDIGLSEIELLLNENVHEYRLTALFMLVLKYQKSRSSEEKHSIFETYVNCIERVNNWDLVDSSAHLILGPYLENRDKKLLYDFAHSSNLWKQRVAVISTFHYIRKGQYDDNLKMAEILINHKHDLIHKAVGWMLREIGKKDFQVEINFLKKHYKKMPRTMLRYSIEKFPEKLRQTFLRGEI